MPDVLGQLERYAEAAARSVPSTGVDAVQKARRPRPWRPLLLAAAVAVLALVAGIALLDTSGSDVRVSTDPPGRGPERPSTTSGDPTQTTGPATRGLRVSPVTAVAGGEYLVWSGEAGANDTPQRADGFAVDLGTGAVRPIPVAPIDPRSGATGVWTGEELIVCCGTGRADGYTAETRSVAAWDPGSGSWRTLAEPPAGIARSHPASVWTGELMVVVARGAAAAAYDPGADRWIDIPAPPLAGTSPEAVWTGEAVIVWDSHHPSLAYPLRGELADRGWAWEPGSDEWSPLPPLPEGARTRLGSMAWTGSEIVIWGLSTHDDAIGVGAHWTPGADRWRPMAPSPQGAVENPYNGTPGSQAVAADTDGRVLVKVLDGSNSGASGGDLHVYDPSGDTWHATGLAVPSYHPPLTVTDGLVLVPDEHAPIVGSLR